MFKLESEYKSSCFKQLKAIISALILFSSAALADGPLDAACEKNEQKKKSDTSSCKKAFYATAEKLEIVGCERLSITKITRSGAKLSALVNGAGNSTSIDSKGAGNTVSTKQSGTNNRVVINQKGSNNVVTVTQRSSKASNFSNQSPNKLEISTDR